MQNRMGVNHHRASGHVGASEVKQNIRLNVNGNYDVFDNGNRVATFADYERAVADVRKRSRKASAK